MNMQDQVRWGVIGCARIAKNWVIPAIVQAEGARLWAVASRSAEKARSTAQEFGAEKVYGSYEELLADPQVDAVYNPLPNHLHKDWTIAALRAGKHVLCEKPIALNAAEAREMEAVSQETGCLLVEAFMYRYTPLVQKALEIVRAGRLGELRMLYSTFTFLMPDDASNFRLQAHAGGGGLYDVGCYAINVQRMLAGREPRSAWARLAWSGKHHVDLTALGVLDFGEQLYGTFDAGFSAAGGSYFRAVGTKGVLEAPEGFIPREKPGLLLLRVGQLTERLTLPFANPYELEVQDTCQAIRGEHPPLFAWEPLDANMRVIDACFAADEAGQAVEV